MRLKPAAITWQTTIKIFWTKMTTSSMQFKTIGLSDSGIDRANFKLENLLWYQNVALTTFLSITPFVPPHHASRYWLCGERRARILIVDQFTGRTMEGRRYSDGLQLSPLKPKKVCQSRMKPRHLPHHVPNLFRIQKLVWRVQVRRVNFVKSTFVLFQSQQTVLFNVLTTQTFLCKYRI